MMVSDKVLYCLCQRSWVLKQIHCRNFWLSFPSFRCERKKIFM